MLWINAPLLKRIAEVDQANQRTASCGRSCTWRPGAIRSQPRTLS